MNHRDLAQALERRLRADQRKDEAVAEAERAIDAMTTLPTVLSQAAGNIASYLDLEGNR